MTKNTGGPAFPLPRDTAMQAGINPSTGALGMTLRDYFAAKSMQSLILIPCSEWPDAPECQEDASVSMAAYKMADAMLAARNEERN